MHQPNNPQAVETWRHPVRLRLEAGAAVFGLTVTIPSVEIVAHAATLGFDFLWVEMEHSPISLETLRLMVLGARGLPSAVFARVPVVELWTAKRVLDQGVSGVIFPFTSTPEQAVRAAAACRYPPTGKRGSGAGAAVRTWPAPGNYYDSADANVVTVCVVEEVLALEHIDAITDTEGIDVIFIGTADLSFSLGLRGEQNHPALDAAIARIVDSARQKGKFLGRPVQNPQQIRHSISQGFQFFQLPTEVGFLERGAREMLGALGIVGFPDTGRAMY